MTVKNSERTYIFTKKPFKFDGFFLRGIHFRKYVLQVERISLAPRNFVAFNKNFFSLFDNSLFTLEYLDQIMLSFKGMRDSVEFSEATIKRCSGNW